MIRSCSCILIISTVCFQLKASDLAIIQIVSPQDIQITVLIVAEHVGRLHGVFKKLIRSGKCFRSVCAYPIVHGGKNHGRALLFPQQYLCIGLFIDGVLCKPCCTRVTERQTIVSAVECGNAVFIPVNPPIFVQILDIYTVIRYVDIVFVIADKTDGIGERTAFKSKGGLRSSGFRMKPYLSFLGKRTAGIFIANELPKRILFSCFLFPLSKQTVHAVIVGKKPGTIGKIISEGEIRSKFI